ncbi:hypothetical protein BGAL_0011g00010 [Botrytis galanthina]|uniref:Uncharacterized protein n=1 Tax=Botrytis galanthina TaxID=278940 RepID=A0A4S8RD62_9HELO|nr:hypothetical protein BGAL_0011g00010 [Botrytis galanthina]
MEMGTEPEMKIEKCDARTKQRGYRTREDAQATTLKIHLFAFAFALHSVEQGRKGTSRKPKYIRVVLQLLYAPRIRPIYRLASPRLASHHGYFIESKYICALRPVLLFSPNL